MAQPVLSSYLPLTNGHPSNTPSRDNIKVQYSYVTSIYPNTPVLYSVPPHLSSTTPLQSTLIFPLIILRLATLSPLPSPVLCYVFNTLSPPPPNSPLSSLMVSLLYSCLSVCLFGASFLPLISSHFFQFPKRWSPGKEKMV